MNLLRARARPVAGAVVPPVALPPRLPRLSLRAPDVESTPPDQKARGTTAEAVLVAATAGFGGLLLIVRAGRADAADLAITLRIQAERWRGIGRVMSAVSWPGFPPQSRIIPPTIMGVLVLAGRRREAAFEGAAWGTALLSTVVKAVVRRPRPMPPQVRVVVAPLGGTSFPSGHVLTYVGVYGFLAYLAHALIRSRPMRLAIVAPLVGLVALVGPSRIQQGHHWPTDVVASYLLGTAYLAGLGALYVRRQRVPAPSAGGRGGNVG